MATELLTVPEEHLREVINVIRSGINMIRAGLSLKPVSKTVSDHLLGWCDNEEMYLSGVASHPAILSGKPKFMECMEGPMDTIKIKTFKLEDLVGRKVYIQSFKSEDGIELITALDLKTLELFVLQEIQPRQTTC